MISIQDLGKEILSNQFRKFYVFLGQEYGVKRKYLDLIASHYEGRQKEIASMKDFIGMMKVKQLIPLKPTLYIVRYDTEFTKSLGPGTASQIQNLHYAGTCVCIYEDSRLKDKFDKYLPEAVATIDSVNPLFIKKYLMSDYPGLDEGLAGAAANIAVNYGQARNIAAAMMCSDMNKLKSMDEVAIANLFGISSQSNEKHLQMCIASKNFKAILSAIERYPEVNDSILYVFTQTMNELEKIKTYRSTDSPLKQYEKYWTEEDIYNFFNHAYSCLFKIRIGLSSDVLNCTTYLAGLLQFSRIPKVEVMECCP